MEVQHTHARIHVPADIEEIQQITNAKNVMFLVAKIVIQAKQLAKLVIIPNYFKTETSVKILAMMDSTKMLIVFARNVQLKTAKTAILTIQNVILAKQAFSNMREINVWQHVLQSSEPMRIIYAKVAIFWSVQNVMLIETNVRLVKITNLCKTRPNVKSLAIQVSERMEAFVKRVMSPNVKLVMQTSQNAQNAKPPLHFKGKIDASQHAMTDLRMLTQFAQNVQ